MAPLAAGCLVFMLVGSPAQERQAGLLIDSIKQAGGELGHCELQAVVSDPDATPGEELRARGATVVPLAQNPPVAAYPFADRVRACAQVERTAGPGRNLIFIDTAILVLKPQPELLLRKGEAAAVRPVHLANLGLAQTAQNEYWARIHALAGLHRESAPLVTSMVDARRIPAYFNAQIVSVRSDAGVLREWARVFDSLVGDEEYQRRACGDDAHRIYLHQAVLSKVLVARAGGGRIRLLPATYAYPLSLHARVPARSRPRSYDDLHSIIYGYAWYDDSDWLAFMPASPALRERLSSAELSLGRVSDGIYRQERSCNTYLVTTAGGSIVIDPAAGTAASSWRRLAASHPPAAVLLTHAHPDHVSGLAEWRADRKIPIVAQRAHADLRAYFERLPGFFARRNAAIDRTGAEKAQRAVPEPTVLFADHHSLEVEGLKLEIQHTPGETPDHATIWIPQLRAVALGDNFYESFPNIGTPRGSLPRSALDYVAALDRAAAVEPDVLLPGHGEPVVGRERVRRRLTEYRDAILAVHDAVVRGMNEGKGLRTLMNEISLPPGSHVAESYGRVLWAVRGIFEGYAGGFDGDVADLYGGGAIDGEVTNLVGGPDTLARRAGELTRSGDPLRGLRLADVAIAADDSHLPSWQARLAALEALRARAHNSIESRLLDRAIEAARARVASRG